LKEEIQDKLTGEDQGLRVDVAKPKRPNVGNLMGRETICDWCKACGN
jgi:hypothetical protein